MSARGLRSIYYCLFAATAACATEPSVDEAKQEVINAPLPSPLILALNAKTTLSIGAFSSVNGDVAASGARGVLTYDVQSQQSFFNNSFANTVHTRTGSFVGHVFGNDLTIEGSAGQQSLGLDPGALPQVPAGTPATAGTTAVTLAAHQQRQLCPGQYGAITLGSGATLSLNGGVYQVRKLDLADGARLEAAEPVVILVTGTVLTSTGAAIVPSQQALNPMSADDLRLEVTGTATFGDQTQLRAHVLVANNKITFGNSVTLTGAAWAKTIALGTSDSVFAEDAFAAVAPQVPPPCNDNSACTVDACVTSGAVAFCRNTPVAAGTSCGDANLCNGDETCNATGQCVATGNAPAGTSCGDGDACDGDETCNGFGTCDPGAPPAVDDNNPCTADACAADAGVSHIPVPDGTACFGTGVCQAGVCSVQANVFSATLPGFQAAIEACTQWNDFVFNQLTDRTYTRVTMTGTFNPFGFTCGDPTAATAICNALHHDQFSSVFCDGHQWTTGECGGPEISVDTSLCVCRFGGGAGTVRPCTNSNWGGINTDTCGATTQTLNVTCE